MRRTTEGERIALRCSARELKAIDAHVHAGGFASRSDLVRAAIEQYLSFSLQEVTRRGTQEDPHVRLKEHELDLVSRFAEHVSGGNLADALAMLVRHGLDKMEADRLVKIAENRQDSFDHAKHVTLDKGRLEIADRDAPEGLDRRHGNRRGW